MTSNNFAGNKIVGFDKAGSNYEKAITTRLENISRKLDRLGIKKGTEFILRGFPSKYSGCFLCKVTGVLGKIDNVLDFSIITSSCLEKPRLSLEMKDFRRELIISPSSVGYEKCKRCIMFSQEFMNKNGLVG